jgi:general transcriptional corepressor CYC8
LKRDEEFEKANEICFRLGIVYKQQRKFKQSLDVKKITKFQCFTYVIDMPPAPLETADIYFQIGHVYELEKNVSF